ncbi:MAG: hypothetical protein R3A46_15160 [Thermomicrobiales bacterium]
MERDGDHSQQAEATHESSAGETSTEEDSKAVDDGESLDRPVDDGLTDEEKVKALHEAELAFQEAVRAGSLINPVREEIGGVPEGAATPPPGVDDPPAAEAPPPDELPEEEPARSGYPVAISTSDRTMSRSSKATPGTRA